MRSLRKLSRKKTYGTILRSTRTEASSLLNVYLYERRDATRADPGEGSRCSSGSGIAWGIVIYTLQFTQPDPLLLNYVGDSVRIVGLAALLAAFFLG